MSSERVALLYSSYCCNSHSNDVQANGGAILIIKMMCLLV